MTVRAKFKVDSIERSKYGTDKEHHNVKLSPVYATNDENKKFYAATPTGSINLGCVNVEAANQFELGEEYYIDFTPAPRSPAP